jgi:hypothetical protein
MSAASSTTASSKLNLARVLLDSCCIGVEWLVQLLLKSIDVLAGSCCALDGSQYKPAAAAAAVAAAAAFANKYYGTPP